MVKFPRNHPWRNTPMIPAAFRAGGLNPHENDEPAPEPDEEDRVDEVRERQREDDETPEDPRFADD